MAKVTAKLKATIRSKYYIYDDNGQKIYFYDMKKAYEYLKNYIFQHKDQSDIVIFDDKDLQIRVYTTNKTLPLDRLVYIDKEKVDIDNLNNNLL